MKILTSLLFLLVTFTSVTGFSARAFVKLGGKTEELNYEPTDTMAAFKHTVGQVFSIPANRVRLIHAGIELKNDQEMGSCNFTDTTSLLVVIKNIAAGESSSADQASSQINYPPVYKKPIERASDAFKSISHFDRLRTKSGEQLREEIDMVKGQMQSILHHTIPIAFMTELIARFPAEKGYSLFKDNQLPLPQVLMEHA